MKIEFEDDPWVLGIMVSLIAILLFIFIGSVGLNSCQYQHKEMMKRIEIEQKAK